jgi:hypothetical protein
LLTILVDSGSRFVRIGYVLERKSDSTFTFFEFLNCRAIEINFMRDSILSNETLFSHAINVGFVSTAADLVETVFAGSALGIATDLGGLE